MKSTQTIQAIGIPWYREADYQQLRALFADGHLLPATFENWQQKAEHLRKSQIQQGRIVVQAQIDPGTFPAWCAARGHNVDASGRVAFANTEAARIARQHHGNT